MVQSTIKPRDCSPGSVVLYRERQSDLPPWPSICLTDDDTPALFLRTRPDVFCIIVLKLASNLDLGQLRWARTSEVIPFDTMNVDETTKRTTPGLKDAYAIANETISSGSDMEYWQVMLASSLDEDVGVTDDDDDAGLRLAIQESLKDYSPQACSSPWLPPNPIYTDADSEALRTCGRSSLPTRRPFQQSPSSLVPVPSSKRKPHPSDYHPPPLKRSESLLSSGSDDDMPQPSQRRRSSYSPFIRQRANPFDFPSRISAGNSTYTLSSDEEDDPSLEPRQKTAQTTINGKASGHASERFTGTSRGLGLSSPSAKQTSGDRPRDSALVAPDDVVEGDIGESDQFVQVFIGPEVDPASDRHIDRERRRYKFQLMKKHVWDRNYFRDFMSARNHFNPIGDNTWELVHPELDKISPEDFTFVAEFLSDGSFGIRDPDDPEQFAEFFAQCMSTWRAAEKLGMDDLLNHIVEKVYAAHEERYLWDLWNPVVFACSIYRSDIALDAHTELKALLSEFIAEYFHAYLDDDYTSGILLTQLKQLPDMERDIMRKRADRLERQFS